MVPSVIFEDEHLLVVNKPAGWNTHAPSPFAGEGIYDFLKHREPRWATLAIIHRLDKQTSGLLVFSKTPLANRSLTEQFAARTVRKKYVLITDRPAPVKPVLMRSSLVRVGDRYRSAPAGRKGETAETRFEPANAELGQAPLPGTFLSGETCRLVIAEPRTGRTHQIRVHAAESGFPVLGDELYGGTPASRVFLHAAEIGFAHPASGRPVTFSTPAHFEKDPRQLLRESVLDQESNTCWRMVHGAADDQPGWYVDKLGDYLLAQSETALDEDRISALRALMQTSSTEGAYHKTLERQVRRAAPQTVSPRLVLGRAAPQPFTVRENGLSFELSFQKGYSIGLFLDQRENRRRLLTGHIGAGFSLGDRLEVLNTFAYTCAFSVCAARAGARTTSLDLSRKYLDWGRRNFLLNGLDPGGHDFIFGDVFSWLGRLARKGRKFDLILLDPPTFSASWEGGTFRAEKDYGKLVAAALPLLAGNGVLFASTNAAGFAPDAFVNSVNRAIANAGRKVVRSHYVPQPPDFPIARAEPAYLKTIWLRVA